MKKKMCKWFGKSRTCYCGHPDWDADTMKPSTAAIKRLCPDNSNSKCEIIPAKPKVVKVKAWAETDGHGEYWVNNIPNYRESRIPCTILIDEKYLGGK